MQPVMQGFWGESADNCKEGLLITLSGSFSRHFNGVLELFFPQATTKLANCIVLLCKSLVASRTSDKLHRAPNFLTSLHFSEQRVAAPHSLQASLS